MRPSCVQFLGSPPNLNLNPAPPSGNTIKIRIKIRKTPPQKVECARPSSSAVHFTARNPTSVQAMAMNASTSDSPATSPEAIGIA